MKLLTPDNFTVNDCHSLLTGLEGYLVDIDDFENDRVWTNKTCVSPLLPEKDCSFVLWVGLYDYLRPYHCLRVYDRFYTYNKIAGYIPNTNDFERALNKTYNQEDYPNVIAYKDKERIAFVEATIKALKKFIKEK